MHHHHPVGLSLSAKMKSSRNWFASEAEKPKRSMARRCRTNLGITVALGALGALDRPNLPGKCLENPGFIWFKMV